MLVSLFNGRNERIQICLHVDIDRSYQKRKNLAQYHNKIKFRNSKWSPNVVVS